jgi:hypothetical protein
MPHILLALLCSLLLVACQPKSGSALGALRIGEESVSQAELDAAIGSLPEFRQQAIATEEGRRAYLRDVVELRLVAQAARARYGRPNSMLAQNLAEMESGEFNHYVQSRWVGRDIGLSQDTLEAWFRAHLADLRKDSTQAFSDLRGKVAEQLLLEGAPLDSFHSANRTRWIEPARAELSVIHCSTRDRAEKAFAALQSGAAFAVVAQQYSEHHTASGGGYYGWIREGEQHELVLGTPGLAESLYGPGRILPSRHTPVMASGPGFVVVQMEQWEPARGTQFAEVRQSVERSYLDELRQKAYLRQNDLLRVRYGIVDRELPAPDVAGWFAQHPERYRTLPRAVLLVLTSKDSTSLAEVLSRGGREAFVAAGAYPVSAKLGASLPGIGMLSALQQQLRKADPRQLGALPALVSGPGGQWHAFWVDSLIPPQPKPLDRVRRAIEVELDQPLSLPYSDTVTMVTSFGKPLVKVGDLRTMLTKIDPRQIESASRSELVALLTSWKLWRTFGEALQWDKEPEWLALRGQFLAESWTSTYRDSLVATGWGVSADTLARLAVAHPGVVAIAGPDRKSEDLAVWYLTPGLELRLEALRMGKGAPFSLEVEKEFWSGARTRLAEEVRRRQFRALWNQVGAAVADTAVHLPGPQTLQAALALGNSLAQAHRTALAADILGEAVVHFGGEPGADSLIYLAGRVAMDANQPERAVQAFERYTLLYPEGAHHDQALFLEGFVLTNGLKRDSAAVAVFEELLRAHPKSEFADDATFLLEDIRCGGCKTNQLMQGLGAPAAE